MGKGIWLNDKTFLDFAETTNRAELTREIATRQTAWDFSGLIGLLPDPDPVLAKHGSGSEVLAGLTADDHVTSVIQTRKVGTLKREVRWSPGAVNEQEPDKAAVTLCAAWAEDMKAIDLRNVISQILDAPLYGFTPLELIWEPGEGRLRLLRIESKPHGWFRFTAENQPRYVSLANREDGEEIPWGKIVFARHFPTYENPYGLRLLSRCFWPVLFKKGGLKFWVTFTEKYGMPFLLGRYARGTSKEDQQKMLSDLVAMVQDAVAVVPDGATVELLGASSSAKGSSDLFDRLISVMDKAISKVIVGQTLTSETSDKGGAYAQSKTHENVLADYQASDQALIKEVFGQIAAIYTTVNAPGVCPPQFTWYEEDDPQVEFANRDKVLSETGVKYSKAYYVRRYGFAEDELEIVEPVGVGIPAATTGKEGRPQGAAPTGKEFSEGDPPTGLDDLLAAKLTAEADPEIAAMIEAIRALTMSAGSLTEISDRLLELYPAMPTAKLVEAMTLSFTGAGLAGRWDVRNGL